MANALDKLVALVDAGVEFPDACYKAAAACGVDYAELEDAYDVYCAGGDDRPAVFVASPVNYVL